MRTEREADIEMADAFENRSRPWSRASESARSREGVRALVVGPLSSLLLRCVSALVSVIDRALKSGQRVRARETEKRGGFSFFRLKPQRRRNTQTFVSAAAGAPAAATAAGLAPKKAEMERCPGGGGPLLRILGAMLEKKSGRETGVLGGRARKKI